MLRSIMRLTAALISLSVLGSLLNVPEASAQANHGAMGAQSGAEVRISVNVFPRFQAKTVSKIEDKSMDAEGIALVAINATNLRYSVVWLGPRNEQSSGSSRTTRDRLLLVVPD